jgi:hypothetical protein
VLLLADALRGLAQHDGFGTQSSYLVPAHFRKDVPRLDEARIHIFVRLLDTLFATERVELHHAITMVVVEAVDKSIGWSAGRGLMGGLKEKLGRSLKGKGLSKKASAFGTVRGQLAERMLRSGGGAIVHIEPAELDGEKRARCGDAELEGEMPRGEPTQAGAGGIGAGGGLGGGSRLQRWRKLLALENPSLLYSQWLSDPMLWTYSEQVSATECDGVRRSATECD